MQVFGRCQPGCWQHSETILRGNWIWAVEVRLNELGCNFSFNCAQSNVIRHFCPQLSPSPPLLPQRTAYDAVHFKAETLRPTAKRTRISAACHLFCHTFFILAFVHQFALFLRVIAFGVMCASGGIAWNSHPLASLNHVYKQVWEAIPRKRGISHHFIGLSIDGLPDRAIRAIT